MKKACIHFNLLITCNDKLTINVKHSETTCYKNQQKKATKTLLIYQRKVYQLKDYINQKNGKMKQEFKS